MQREEFKRLGVIGDWENPYLTMSFDAEAVIAGELMKFAMTGQLYRGSKPVMWSVVERTALAEAEIEYHDYESDTIWVKFPVRTVHGGRRHPDAKAISRSQTLRRHLDDDPLDHPRQPRHLLFLAHRLRSLRGHGGRERFRAAAGRKADLRRQARRGQRRTRPS